MSWTGKWRNQYGSVVTITDDAHNRIAGTFVTALSDSGFFGEEVPVVGIHQGDLISFAFGRKGPTGDTICSFTGMLREGKMQTLWHVVSDAALRAPAAGAPARLEKHGWAHSTQTNADTFERVT